MGYNLKKEATLGMGFGKATQRLRKMILFSLVVRLKENHCFVCSKVIDKVEDLSIEHKLPWEGRSAELFWDLNNIAFSHLRCNRPHAYGTNRKRRENPEGKIWCAGHRDFLSVDNFHKKSSTPTGYQVNCKDCHYKTRQKSFGRLAHSGERRFCKPEAVGA
jgi:hypothetical protein